MARTDWKAYILPLLFFKRISDGWDEETAAAIDTYGETDAAAFPEEHRFEAPEGCHWRDVRQTPKGVGAALSRPMREIERANPDTLSRVFVAADWSDRAMLGDAILKDLVEGLSAVPLGNLRPGQTGVAVVEPSSIRQLIGKGCRSFVRSAFSEVFHRRLRSRDSRDSTPRSAISAARAALERSACPEASSCGS